MTNLLNKCINKQAIQGSRAGLPLYHHICYNIIGCLHEVRSNGKADLLILPSDWQDASGLPLPTYSDSHCKCA